MTHTIEHIFFDIAQGQASICIDTTTGAALMVDCAKGSGALAEAELARNGSLHLLLITHLDMDHCADLMKVVNSCDPEVVRLNLDTAWKQDRDHKQLLALLRGLRDWSDQKRPARFKSATTECPPNDPPVGSISWQILAPEQPDVMTAHDVENRNRASVVLQVVSNGRRILYCGDTDATILSRVSSDRPGVLKADVLVFPHHGGKWHRESQTDLKDEILKEIDPEILLISAGGKNMHGHPLPENLVAARRVGSPRIVCTQVTPRCFGAKTVEEHRESVRGLAGLPLPSNPTCAGTFRVNVHLDGSMYTDPDVPAHAAKIAQWPQPCCTVPLNTPP